jgi:hypothetical protein
MHISDGWLLRCVIVVRSPWHLQHSDGSVVEWFRAARPRWHGPRDLLVTRPSHIHVWRGQGVGLDKLLVVKVCTRSPVAE